mgnify:CR=1 FL=1
MKKALGLLVVVSAGAFILPSTVSGATIDEATGRAAENDAKISFESTGKVLRITTLDDLDFGTKDASAGNAGLVETTNPAIGVQDTFEAGWHLQVKYKTKTSGLITPTLTTDLSYDESFGGTAPSGNTAAPTLEITESTTGFVNAMSADEKTGTGSTRYFFSTGSALTFGGSSTGANQSMTLSWNLASGPAQ